MCQISRRKMLLGSAAAITLTATHPKALANPASPPVEVGKVENLAPDIYFHEGNLALGHCNNGWIIFADYVLVIDANFPSGAQVILPKIRALTDKPIRFAFNTHHHGDHAYGNQVWIENGATPLAHTGVVDEMKKYETGYYGGSPGRWEDTAKQRKDVAAAKLKPPSLLFPKDLIFDDGKHRVELMHLGIAHTHGDALAWLPNEKILFTGDACVNGPYNFVGDGDIEKWIATLELARQLGAKFVCPGHGVFGAESLLADQQAFFKALREGIGKLVKVKKSPQQVKDSVAQLATELKANAQIARYVSERLLMAQSEKVFMEMTGQKFPETQKTSRDAQHWHSHQHGLELVVA
ncbi:MAG: MBL fold metallo-hydrolase [Acidobacteria bacterium]|nr:MBL fold metallo-hydrolase [Acidobacteriota bacterium]